MPEGVLGWLELTAPWRFALFLALVAVAALIAWLVPESAELTDAGRRALFVLVLATLLWVSEAIPAFAVGILVIALQVLLLGRPTSEDGDWQRHLLVLGNPLIWLFFGGLVLAAGMSQTGVDRWLASHALSRFADRPRSLIVAVAGITFVLSMIMSNTATAAMMLALIAPIVRERDPADPFASSLMLAVPVGANLGGMGSLVGTPPNAIAAGMLADQAGVTISFARWFTIGLPPALLLEALLLAVLLWRLRGVSLTGGVQLGGAGGPGQPPRAAHWQVLVVGTTLLLTLGLWLTQDLHGLPTPVVAVVPVVLLTSTGILDVAGFRRLSWDVLFLLAGGLALGQAVHGTGLAAWLVAFFSLQGLPALGFAMAAGLFAVVLSNVMSNTAAANVLVPLVLSAAAAGTATGAAGAVPAITVALCASAAMALPVATPPNALAYATGRLASRDFMVLGLVTGVLTPPLAALWATLVAPG